jgi:hypothetical protein
MFFLIISGNETQKVMRELSLKFLIYFKSKYFPQVWLKIKNLVQASHAFIQTKLRMDETELLNTRGFPSVTSAKATIYPAKQ